MRATDHPQWLHIPARRPTRAGLGRLLARPKDACFKVERCTQATKKKGVEGALMQQIYNQFLESRKYKDIIMTWVGDFNPKMLKLIEGLGANPYQKLKTYRLLFDKNAEFKRYPIHA